MIKKTLRILASQANFTVGAIEENAKKIKSIILNHQTHHDLIVFPELALTGYPPEDLLFRKTLYERVDEALKSIETITQTCHVIIGHPWIEFLHEPLSSNNRCFNAASIYYQGHCVQRYYKQQLPNHGVFDEKRYFTPGPPKPCLLTIHHYQLALCICEDIWQPGPVEQILTAGADILVCINASPYDYQKQQQRLTLLKEHTQKGLAMVYVNLVGGQDDLVFDGQSMAMDQTGNLCA